MVTYQTITYLSVFPKPSKALSISQFYKMKMYGMKSKQLISLKCCLFQLSRFHIETLLQHIA